MFIIGRKASGMRRVLFGFLAFVMLLTGTAQYAGASPLDASSAAEDPSFYETVTDGGLTGPSEAQLDSLAAGVPVLNTLPEWSRESFAELSGYAEAGSEVMIWYTIDAGEERQLETPAVAEDDGSGFGRFDLSMTLEAEGEYLFYAASRKSGDWSDRSSPASVKVDWTAPYDVQELRWELLSHNMALLNWSPPASDTGEPVLDVAKYVVYDGTTNEELGTTPGTFIRIPDLTAGKRYVVLVTAIDHAGNESPGMITVIGASPEGEMKLVELSRHASEEMTISAMSRDGSMIAYTDLLTENAAERSLFVFNTTNRHRILASVTKELTPLDGYVNGIAINGSGKRVVFVSDASNLLASPSEEGEHVYVYDLEHQTMRLISSPGVAAGHPSISDDGRWIVYEEEGRLYLYDYAKETRKLVSETADGEEENGTSNGAVISGNGGMIAFVSDSSNLKGMETSSSEQAVYMYDTVEGRIVKRYVFNTVHSDLAINQDGRYLAYNDSPESGAQALPYVLDMATGDRIDLNGGRSEDEVLGKYYEKLSISDDGRYVLALLHDMRGDGYLPYRYSERFDKNRPGQPAAVGNPAFNHFAADMSGAGNKLVYVRNNALYTYCAPNCDTSEPTDPVHSASLTIPGTAWLSGELKQNSRLTIQATGQKGQQVQAVMRYWTAGPDSEERTATIELEEAAEGIYRGYTDIGAGIATISSIEAKLADGEGSKPVDGLPIQVAGQLSIDIETEQSGLLTGTTLYVSDNKGVTESIPVNPAVTEYTLPVRSGKGYKLELRHDASSVILASRTGITAGKGLAVPIVLKPAFSSELEVTLEYEGGIPAEQATVRFAKAADDSLLGSVQTDAGGKAKLPGTHKAGETIRISVTPPPGYLPVEPKEQVLLIGANQARFRMASGSSAVTSVKVNFDGKVDYHNMPIQDSNAALVVKAKPGLELKAELKIRHWEEDEEREATAEIPLTESEPGVYTGSYRIAAGTSYLKETRIAVNGHLGAAAYPIETSVAGRIAVVFDIPEGKTWSSALSGGTLNVYQTEEVRKHYRSFVKTIAGQTIYTLNVPYGDVPYSIAFSPAAYAVMPVQGLSTVMKPGREETLTLKPKFRFQLNGDVKNNKNARIPISYTLSDSSGNLLLRGTGNGTYDMRLEGFKDEIYKLDIVSKDSLYEGASIELALNELTMKTPVILEEKALQKLEGKVLTKAGKPAAGARVTAAMNGKVFYASSASNGSYTLQLPEGQAFIRAAGSESMGIMSRLETLDMVAGSPATLDLQLLDYAKVQLNIYTKQLGSGWQGPLEPDSRLAWSLMFQPSHSIKKYGSPVSVAAVEGDTFRLCVNGRRAGLPAICEETVIGDNNQAELDLRLEGSGAQATAQFVKPDGQDPGNVALELDRLVEGKAVYGVYAVKKQGDQYLIDIQTPGSYRLRASGSNGMWATVDFDVKASELIPLGEIRLQERGSFGGRAGNSLSVSSDQTTQDGGITVRALYANAGAAVSDASIELDLPKGTTVIPGSVIANGQNADWEWQDDGLKVRIGNIAAKGSGSVQLGLRVDGDPAETMLPLAARIAYSTSGSVKKETIGTAHIQVFAVTLRVPEVLVKPQFGLSGSAPRGSTVYVYDGERLIGTAESSPAGSWKLDAEIADPQARKHRIRTEALVNGIRLIGQEAIVLYDEQDPGLEEMTVGHPGGRVHTIRPENGVAVFPFVYVPGNPFIYHLKFRNPERIHNVQVWTGDTVTDAVLQKGEFVATMTLTKDPGPVYVTYSQKADPNEPIAGPPSEEELRHTLPEAMRSFEVVNVTFPGEETPGGEELPANTLASSIKINEDISGSIRISSSTEAYVPTAKDLREEAATGIPVYGTTMSITRGGKGAKAVITAYVPNGNSSGRASLSGGMAKIKMVIEALNTGTKIFDLDNTLESFMNPGATTRIYTLRDEAQKLCDPQAAEYYTRMADGIIFDIMFVEYVKNLLNVIGGKTFEGPHALIFWAESYWAGKKLDSIVEESMNELERYLKKYDCKVKPYPQKPLKRPPVANPAYIYDPSGFVYEGLTANRLEGATATVLQLDSASGSWDAWNAEWYEQINPQQTDSVGRYGWDVPPGMWKVKVEKDGYVTAYSDELEVPPPHFNVNIPLVSYNAPEVVTVRALPGGTEVQVSFTKPISAASITEGVMTVEGLNGEAVEGALGPIDAEPGVDGSPLAMAIAFRPAEPLTAGETYRVTIGGSLVSYAGIGLEVDTTQDVLVTGTDYEAPDEVDTLIGGMTRDQATLIWNDPRDADLKAVRVKWKAATESAYAGEVEVVKGQMWATVTSIDASKNYDFKVTTIDEYGNESTGVAWRWNADSEAGDDVSPPSAVAELAVQSAAIDSVSVAWKDPAAPDIAKLIVKWWPEADASKVQSKEVLPGVQAYRAGSLSAKTKYVFEVIAVDAGGNESFASNVVAETLAGGGGHPGNNGGGSGGGQTPHGEQYDDAGAWKVNTAGGTYEAFEGRLKLFVAPGTFGHDTKLAYGISQEDDAPVPAGYARYSPSYLLESEGSASWKPIRMTLAYQASSDAGEDPRSYGIYRKDASAPGGWRYVGGVTNRSEAAVSTFITQPGEYAVMVYAPKFADLSVHWSRAEVMVLVARHMASGVSPGRFEPDRAITRAEAVKLLVELLRKSGLGVRGPIKSDSAKIRFTDVPADAWYESYIRAGLDYGLIEGSGGRMRPLDVLSREEMAVLLVRLAALLNIPAPSNNEADQLDSFTDAGNVSAWARKSVTMMLQLGWMKGISTTKLAPDGSATRAQTAVLLVRIMQDAGLLTEDK
ncbi:S-layer homology domain-containing protein [Paenibacillus eucommiae]|uniref:Fibronectin type-III domain-containing protein n=1 Tax=Paenibacillus eucommiae TaxID=1355755 RepID=A0ABS4J4F0_9BACL|nr:S-layer homology domain-containing protein [Paenibacillus eucommiae]MBP1994695.1 hypothetical protein [Paenibacillus eucommiae]